MIIVINKLLYSYQSGFRVNNSIDICLSGLTNMVFNGAENGLNTGMISKDLRKGFDTINHKSLSDKMKGIGFSN